MERITKENYADRPLYNPGLGKVHVKDLVQMDDRYGHRVSSLVLGMLVMGAQVDAIQKTQACYFRTAILPHVKIRKLFRNDGRPFLGPDGGYMFVQDVALCGSDKDGFASKYTTTTASQAPNYEGWLKELLFKGEDKDSAVYIRKGRIPPKRGLDGVAKEEWGSHKKPRLSKMSPPSKSNTPEHSKTFNSHPSSPVPTTVPEPSCLVSANTDSAEEIQVTGVAEGLYIGNKFFAPGTRLPTVDEGEDVIKGAALSTQPFLDSIQNPHPQGAANTPWSSLYLLDRTHLSVSEFRRLTTERIRGPGLAIAAREVGGGSYDAIFFRRISSKAEFESHCNFNDVSDGDEGGGDREGGNEAADDEATDGDSADDEPSNYETAEEPSSEAPVDFPPLNEPNHELESFEGTGNEFLTLDEIDHEFQSLDEETPQPDEDQCANGVTAAVEEPSISGFTAINAPSPGRTRVPDSRSLPESL